jgi:glycine/D-amino acid oxidase-like deaminating enzyme
MDRFDFAILGQGLAGTTLAWHLRWRGFRVAVIDRGDIVTASRVAAGLVTPITGKRLAKSWRFERFFTAAVEFYRRVEVATGEELFTRRPVVRLFRDERERAIFAGRSTAEFRGLVSPEVPVVDPTWFANRLGGFEMTTAGQLAVPRYLDASREQFRIDGGFRTHEVYPADLEFEADAVTLPRLDLSARVVVFCQGFAAAKHPLFRFVPFAPAKGDILTIRAPGLAEHRVLNCGVWLAPVAGDVVRAGSTYDRDNLDCTPTPAGREEICSRLREFVRLPFEVIGHVAAVRPIVDDRKPVLGILPGQPRVGFFNGLGSKGTLLAPYYADHLAAFLAGERPLDPDVDLRQYWRAGSDSFLAPRTNVANHSPQQ